MATAFSPTVNVVCTNEKRSCNVKLHNPLFFSAPPQGLEPWTL